MSEGWAVYMLRCKDGSLYTGATNDLAQRVARHASGKGAAYTRSRLPVALVFEEKVADRGAALRREAQIKRLSRAEKLALLATFKASSGAWKSKRAGAGAGGRPARRRGP